MDIESLQLFLDVWKYGSITSAANNHYMTQPAVGKRIALLEKELGIKLLQRGKGQSQVKITVAGKAFSDIADRMLILYNQAMELQKDAKRKFLTLACIRSAHDEMLPQMLVSLKSQQPNLCITIEDHHTDEIFSLLENRRVDIGIAQSAAPSNNLISELIYEEEYRVVMRKTIISQSVKILHPHQLPAEHGIFQEFDQEFQNWFDQWWQPYSVKIRVNTTPTAEQYFSSKEDWMIVPAATAASLEKRGFSSYSLKIQPSPHRVYIVYNKRSKAENMEYFISKTKEYFQKIS